MRSSRSGVVALWGPTLRRIVSIVLVLAIALVAAENVFARGGFRGGGFRFSGGYRSLGGFRSSRSPAGSIFRWGSSTRRSSTSSWGRSRASLNTATAIGGSRASMASQRSLYTSAQRQGTLFSTRQEAEQAFRSRFASRYTSRFAGRPAARPSYIPSSTVVGGKRVNVIYSPQMGGYGYVDPLLGHWVFYNALANAAFMNSVMASHSYWWGAPPAYYATSGPGFFTWAIILFFAFMALSALLRMLGGAARRRW